MSRSRHVTWPVVFSIAITGLCTAQDSALERAKSEAARVRQLLQPSEDDFSKNVKAFRDRSVGLHAAMRDWVEFLIPKSSATLDAEFPFLNPRASADLQRAGLLAPDNSGDFFEPPPGSVTRLEFSRTPEDPAKLIAIVGIGVPCGSDDAVYVYDYGRGQPRRVLESHGTRDHDESISDVRFSKIDSVGAQSILALRYAVQCGSSWNELSYDWFTLPSMAGMATPILGGEQGIWFGADKPYQVRIESDDLLMEVRDRSIAADIHNRPHVLHFKAEGSIVARIDPVALLPQDFVDEWLTRPWSEMESRSTRSEGDKLRRWHEFLAGGFVAGDFQFVQQCKDQPDQWQVALDLHWIKGKELPDGLSLYFLVQQSSRYGFELKGISFERQSGCPGESQPSSESPTLFPASQRKP